MQICMNTVMRSFAGHSSMLQDNFYKTLNIRPHSSKQVDTFNLYNCLRDGSSPQLLFKLHSYSPTHRHLIQSKVDRDLCFSRSQYGSQDLMMCFMFLVYLSYLSFSLQDPVNPNCRFSHQVPSRGRIKLVMRKLFWSSKGGASAWNTSQNKSNLRNRAFKNTQNRWYKI